MAVVSRNQLNFDYKFSKLDSLVLQSQSKKDILIIDNNMLILRNLGMMLTKNGFTVYGASSEFESLELFYNNINNIELILIDCFSSETNALELFSIYKTLNPNLKILMLVEDNFDFSFFENLEIEAFIVKPIQLNELVSVLEKMIYFSQ